jgi:hypothetical protein
MQEQQFENFGACREVKFHRARSLKRSPFGQVLPATSAPGPGCVKSPSFKLRVEYLSQFRRCGNRLHWQLLSEDDN